MTDYNNSSEIAECTPMTEEERISYEKDRARLDAEAAERHRDFEESYRNSPEGREAIRKLSRNMREIYNEDYANIVDVEKFTSEEWDKFVIKNSRHSYGSYVISAAIHMVQFEKESVHDMLCEDFPGLSGAQEFFAEQIACRLLDTGIIEAFFD